ncbi:MAG TPA: alpha/beta hydrolase [Aromatoleum sp.]|uniref:alpha/beta fold hydrolase n=1 Tax=Aromatoleum sp. TaxID=2307007 RepID=UPI002B45E381|nr:alpha/beta hydrolase [Aromatoleum sp.]HJV25947.1 alpha/beta hydrolase [Aromatoleum sp.]
MTDLQTPGILSHDHWIEHPLGRIFARSWTPSNATAASRSDTPIVLFHDSLGCVELWRDFPANLSAATGRRAIAYDRLGFGKSDARTGRPALDFVAEEATAYFPIVREQLGFQRFIALGHSVGGGMAIHCAAAFTADCEALITESAQVFPEDRTLESIAVAKEQFKDETQIGRLAKYHGDKARWVLEAWTESWLHPDFASWSLAPVLPSVSCPVLALQGIHDEYGSTCHPEMIGQLSAGPSQVEILPDTYHVPHRENPGTVLNLVSEFLDSLR